MASLDGIMDGTNPKADARLARDIAGAAGHTPGPWIYQEEKSGLGGYVWHIYADSARSGAKLPAISDTEANARLIAAAPDLYGEAQVLRCLATSPRFQTMTVAEALAELANNGCGHDGGAAIAKAGGAA